MNNWLRKYFFGNVNRREVEKFKRFKERNIQEELMQFISNMEEKYNITLTDSAIEMLLIPLEERYANEKDKIITNRDYIFKSIQDLFEEMSLNKNITEELFVKEAGERSSLSVIKAYHKKYCNIPPFCERTN